MIFTVGVTSIYDSHIDSPKGFQKGSGGSVWRFYKDAYEYLEKTDHAKRQSVYAVDADWFKDTVAVEKESFRNLKKDSKVYRVLRHVNLPKIENA
jgi:hypothetical protein